MEPLRASMPSCLRQWSCRVNLLSLKIGSLSLGSVYLIRRTGQHISRPAGTSLVQCLQHAQELDALAIDTYNTVFPHLRQGSVPECQIRIFQSRQFTVGKGVATEKFFLCTHIAPYNGCAARQIQLFGGSYVRLQIHDGHFFEKGDSELLLEEINWRQKAFRRGKDRRSSGKTGEKGHHPSVKIVPATK